MQGSDGTDVDLAALEVYATRLAGVLRTLDATVPMARPAPLGQGGLLEAAQAAALHGQRLDDQEMFLRDAAYGLQALQQAARSIAATYASSDARSAASLKNVEAMFTSVPGQSTGPTANTTPTGTAERSPSVVGPDVPNPGDMAPDGAPTDESGANDAEQRVGDIREEYGGLQDWSPDPRPLLREPGEVVGDNPGG